MAEETRPSPKARIRDVLDQLVAEARRGPGSRVLRKLPDWMILLIVAVGPILVFGVLLAAFGRLDEFFELPALTILGALAAIVVGTVVGGFIGLSDAKRRPSHGGRRRFGPSESGAQHRPRHEG